MAAAYTDIMPNKGAAGGMRLADVPRASTRRPAHLWALTLNIGAAAVSRAEAILKWLGDRNDDVIVLTETSAGLGTRNLMSGLQQLGYEVHGRPDSGGRDRGVVVATRVPIAATLDDRLRVTLPWRAVGIVLETEPRVGVLGVYVPSRDRSEMKIARKRAFIASLLESVSALPMALRSRLMLVGDYNVVPRNHDPVLPGFFPYEYAMHDELARIGFTAAHELCGPRVHPHSWIGRTGTGYLYDYVHAGSELHDRVMGCEYLDAPRSLRLSDHAAVAAAIHLRHSRKAFRSLRQHSSFEKSGV